MSIGQTFTNTKRVVVLVENEDGTQHGFEVDGGTVRWEWTGMADGPTMGVGSAGRVTVEGRFHRKNRDPIMQAVLDAAADRSLPGAPKEITDGNV